jgi:hypothetical protein
MQAKLYLLDDRHLLFHCPGCHRAHLVRVRGPGPVEEWNMSMDEPSFTSSLVYCGQDDRARCHCMVRDGLIEYLAGTGHCVAGHRLLLPDWADAVRL